MEAALLESEKQEDFTTIKILMNLGSSFCLKKDNGSLEFIRVCFYFFLAGNENFAKT